MENEHGEQDIRSRLIQAALDCFLADEYHRVTTRQIARNAGANVSMIHYYFGSKQGLYEAMIAHTLEPLMATLESLVQDSQTGFSDFFKIYYDTMAAQPAFPKQIIKVLTLKHGPGRRFVQQLLARGRAQGARMANNLQANGQVTPAVNPDMMRMSFVSLAVTPMLLKEIFEEQLGRPMDRDFLHALAEFNGNLLTTGLATFGQTEDKNE